MRVGDSDIDFLIDSGAARTAVNQPLQLPVADSLTVVGATGKGTKCPVYAPAECALGNRTLSHKLVYLPDCPTPLLGRDLLCRLGATLHFTQDEITLTLPPENAWIMTLATEPSAMQAPEWSQWEKRVFPLVWASGIPGKATRQTPVHIQLLPGKSPVQIKQYPIKREAREGLQETIDRFLECGVLRECQSAWNTPILPVRKPNGTYRLVQDLRAVNERVKTLHPLVPNPYTLLASIGGQYTHFSVLDLKDAFFTIPVDTQSQEIFSFEWEDNRRVKKQLCWTVLAQGFKNSPTLFGQALARDLEEWDNEDRVLLLQYVDDLLIAAVGLIPCLKATVSLLNFVGLRGYRVAKSKAQIALSEVRYLGFYIRQGERQLSSERKEAICQIPIPSNRKQLRAFLGMAGFCRIWIPEFGLWAKPLYECVKGADHDPFHWSPEADRAFKILKRKLMEAPALGLPDLAKPFQLYVHERRGVALGVLTQLLGTWKRPVAYFSKQLDQVAKGWPACLWAVAATALVLGEAEKLTLGGAVQVYTPHMVQALLDTKGGLWLTQARVARYQAKLVENPEVTLQTCPSLNPATLLPETEEQEHDCLEIIDVQYSSRPDLKDQPLPNADSEWYTDGSSTVVNGQRRAGYAIVSLHETVEAESLPAGTSAQLAELVALTRALELSKGKRVNIFTDSRYAFGVLHAHAGLWKQRGMLTAQGSPVKHGPQILRLLEAVQLPSEVAVIHCKAHQREDQDVAKGNARADREAKRAATLEPQEAEDAHMHALIPSVGELPTPQYSHEERNLANTLGLQEKEGWLHSTEGKILLPRNLLRPVLQKLHQSTHAGREALSQLMNKYFLTSGLRPLASQVQAECLVCQKNNPRPGVSVPPATLEPTPGPGLVWQIDFTEFPRTQGFRYLLVLVDRFSGWPEAFPCRNNTAKTVALKFVKEIIPRFGLPRWMESDNGTHFTSQVVQKISDALQIPWKLHTPWRPQASGVVERTNQTLKRHLSKVCQEASLKWPDALPLVLLRIRALPKGRVGLSPFEIMFGRAWPMNGTPVLAGEWEIGYGFLSQYMCSLSAV
ncbi:protein NYNRIN-like, partial [Trachemys scripta elegans]|uniref:protein NYNRIN-like n=1 Tax=Trachemys scripta elegans TaxID=31138 RepID=UPI001554B2B1